MLALLIAAAAGIALVTAYFTYGRWLSRRVFRLDSEATCPSVAQRDDRDYVPTKRGVVFGHHFTSIAGTGPIVGPAIAVFWGWLPALVWIVLGSIFIGAVHDFGSLVVSLRNRGMTVGDVAGRLINARSRVLFLSMLFLALMVVIGIFGLVIATIFANYPSSVFPIWIQIPIAVAVGWLVYRRNWRMLPLALIALVVMYFTIWVGAYHLPINLREFGLVPNGAAAVEAGMSPFANAVVVWTLALLVYCFVASVLPVWTLLQPRDYINSHQLIVALALLVAGLFAAPFWASGFAVAAQPINTTPPAGAPPIMPFLFITIACGAVSGFHCLVSSGTSSKQLSRETDARAVGYGAMLLEGALATIVILACVAGLSLGVYAFDGGTGTYKPFTVNGVPLQGEMAYAQYYGAAHWDSFKLSQKIGAFIEGGANLLAVIGIPITFGISLTAVLVACFAATTLDTATRLQRYVITELGSSVGFRIDKYVATGVAVVSGGAIAMISGPLGPGSGGLILWPIFGATNQMLAGLSFLVIAFYLLRRGQSVWFLLAPMVLMLVLPAWALTYQLPRWWADERYILFALGAAVFVIQIWMVIEAALLWNKARGGALAGVLPAQAAD